MTEKRVNGNVTLIRISLVSGRFNGRRMDIYKIKLWIARSSIMSIAPAVDFGSRFARTVILSRLLARDEFGVAVAITVMLGIASLVTDVAIDKFAIIEADESGKE